MTGDRVGTGRRGEIAVVVRPVRRADPAVEIIRHALAKGVTRLIASEPIARAGTDPEGVHQTRVATRRMRSDLQTFRPLLDREWTQALRAELKWLGSELGAVRDLDVLRMHLDTRAATLDSRDQKAIAPVFAAFDTQWTAARAHLDQVLRSSRYHALRDDLAAAANAPVVTHDALTPARDVVPPLVAKAWKRLRRSVADLPETPSDEQLHDVRIHAKRARYAAEAVSDAFGKPARRFAKAMGQLQETLGDHNDAIVAQEWLRAHALEAASPEAVYALGVMGGRFHADATDARRRFPAAWHDASRERLRSWL